VIKADKNLEKAYDEFFTGPDAHATKPKTAKQDPGGETANDKK
jgi:hypothetical protein